MQSSWNRYGFYNAYDFYHGNLGKRSACIFLYSIFDYYSDRLYYYDRFVKYYLQEMNKTVRGAEMYEGAKFSFEGDFLSYPGLENMGMFTCAGDVKESVLEEIRKIAASL